MHTYKAPLKLGSVCVFYHFYYPIFMFKSTAVSLDILFIHFSKLYDLYNHGIQNWRLLNQWSPCIWYIHWSFPVGRTRLNNGQFNSANA